MWLRYESNDVLYNSDNLPFANGGAEIGCWSNELGKDTDKGINTPIPHFFPGFFVDMGALPEDSNGHGSCGVVVEGEVMYLKWTEVQGGKCDS